MDFSRLSNTGRNTLWLIGQVILAVLCIGYMLSVYYQDILPNKSIRDTFDKTDCLIVGERIATTGTIIKRYRAEFLVRYAFKGLEFSSWVATNGLDNSFTMDRQSQDAALNQFVVKHSYPCWYNPNQPQVVVLVMRHNWASTFPLFLPAIVLLILIYFIWRSVHNLAVIAKREKIEKESKNR